jgi:hypothetical protein
VLGLLTQLFCVAPASIENVPAGQGVQDALPGELVHAPARHCEHVVAPAAEK